MTPPSHAAAGRCPLISFTHETLAQRVVLEAGAAATNVAAEVERLGASHAMVIAATSGRQLAIEITAGAPVALHWDEVLQHVPSELADRAGSAAVAADVDALVSVGGGSATGLAKAIALRTGLPIIAVPTTYAGSEATPIWGLTTDHRKVTGSDPVVLPVSVVYDADLTLSFPVGLSVASGLNALAHCIDALWAPQADPINTALALEGIRALAGGLPRVVDQPTGRVGRSQCLYGAYLSGRAFGSAGSGLHHKLCHVLGGAFDLPHAQTHAVVLPHVLALNAPAVPAIARRVADALSDGRGRHGWRGRAGPGDAPGDAVRLLVGLIESLGAPRSLTRARAAGAGPPGGGDPDPGRGPAVEPGPGHESGARVVAAPGLGRRRPRGGRRCGSRLSRRPGRPPSPRRWSTPSGRLRRPGCRRSCRP